MDFDINQVVTTLWKIIPILDEYDDNHGASANQLFEKITSSFSSENIPLQNIAAFGSDGCITMMGARNSVAQRFREINPDIIIKCPSHSIECIYAQKMQ